MRKMIDRLFGLVMLVTGALFLMWMAGSWRYDEPGHGHCPSVWGCKASDVAQ